MFGPVTLEISEGWLVALVGPEQSGRTSLLLTLAGRMDPSAGTVDVLGHRLPHGRRLVHRHTALAGFDGIDTLDEGLTVAELLQERADLSVPLWRRPLRVGDERMAELARTVFGPDAPDLDTQVWHLSALQTFQLRLLIALVGAPTLLVVDDVDAVRDPDEQRQVWRSLQRICGLRITVVATAASATAIPADVHVLTLDTLQEA